MRTHASLLRATAAESKRFGKATVPGCRPRFATVYKRWQATGMLVVFSALAVVLLGLLALTTWQGWWPQVGAWLVAQTPPSTAGWVSLFCAVLACGLYLTLRKATP